MLIFLFLVTFFPPFFPKAPAAGADEIRWIQRQTLAYNDFKGSVPENTPWAALTSTYIYFTYGTTNGKLTSYHVYAAFRKNESWIKTKNENVLSHEQLHFDIAEAFSRKLYK